MELANIRDKVRVYYAAYFAELRTQTARYDSMREAIPRFLSEHSRRLIVVVGSDGAVIEHRADEFIPDEHAEFFEFHYYYRDRGIQELSGVAHDPDVPARVKVAELRLHKGQDTSGPVVWESPWERQDTVNNAMIANWNAELGRADAKGDILVFVNSYLMNLHVSPQETQPRVIQELNAAITEFRELLNSEPSEGVIQQYLGTTRNRILLEPSAIRIIPQVALGSEYRLDFAIEQPQRQYIVVEIEKPEHRVFTKTGQVTAKVTEAQQQVEDWLNWIRDHSSYAREEILPGIREPEGWVVIGRRHSMSESDQRALEGRNAHLQSITVMTYDDLLDKADQHLQNLSNL